MTISNVLPLLVLLLALLPTQTLAHFPSECRCVCHIAYNALSKARDDCFLPRAGRCRVRLCRDSDFAGFSCCLPDLSSDSPDASPPQTFPLSFVTPSPSRSPVTPSVDPAASLQASVHASSLEPFMNMGAEEGARPFVSPMASLSPTPLTPPLPRPESALVRFAADDMARLYINGVLISAINDWAAFATVSTRLYVGDVVGVEVMDTGGRWHGMIAEIEFTGGAFVTGRDEWRAVDEMEVVGAEEQWQLRGFDACAWPLMEVREGEGVWFAGKAIGFPRENGARYVWAANATGGTVFVRFVIGGEECS